jgi:hypothetical protein
MTKMVCGEDRLGALKAATFKSPTGTQTPAESSTLFFTGNWVSPMLPTHVVSRPQGRGTEQRV